ncbi:MAG: alpha/beta fold hydrolase [bacterium]|nr:alpha/beta fold hydrolase [bacterium]
MTPLDFPIGVHHLHEDTSLDFQLNRLAGLGGGRIEEIREVAPRIRDLDDWKREFLALAERALSEGRPQHAAAYYRAAEFFMAEGDPDKAMAYERQAKLFLEIFEDDLASGHVRMADVPYESGCLRTWHLKVPEGRASKGTIVVHGGFDSYGEELYPWVRSFPEAGYDVLLFEGPGQGGVIRLHGIPFTTEWEKPVGKILDHFGLDDVTLLGISLGGYLAPRAAAFEPRIQRVIAFDVCWDMFEAGLSTRPPLLRGALRLLVALGADSLLDKLVARQMERDPFTRWAVEHGTYVMAADRPSAYFKTMRDFTTRHISSRITQDFLLLAGTEDHYMPLEHFHLQARALTNVRSFTGRIFTKEESAHTHCQIGNFGLALRVILDWINERTTSRSAGPNESQIAHTHEFLPPTSRLRPSPSRP